MKKKKKKTTTTTTTTERGKWHSRFRVSRAVSSGVTLAWLGWATGCGDRAPPPRWSQPEPPSLATPLETSPPDTTGAPDEREAATKPGESKPTPDTTGASNEPETATGSKESSPTPEADGAHTTGQPQ